MLRNTIRPVKREFLKRSGVQSRGVAAQTGNSKDSVRDIPVTDQLSETFFADIPRALVHHRNLRIV
jgi:hypothetical protein